MSSQVEKRHRVGKWIHEAPFIGWTVFALLMAWGYSRIGRVDMVNAYALLCLGSVLTKLCDRLARNYRMAKWKEDFVASVQAKSREIEREIVAGRAEVEDLENFLQQCALEAMPEELTEEEPDWEIYKKPPTA